MGVEDGRRCLSLDEMQGLNFRRDSRGRWSDPSQHPGARLRKTPHETKAL